MSSTNAVEENPFQSELDQQQNRETRSETRTMRWTPSEIKAAEELAAKEGVDVVDLVREGMSRVFDARRNGEKSKARTLKRLTK